ncbi:hypothetical protein F4Z98_17835 [Candidatus Poribacteria bacterium]|nr:hypothetical protein [Candidatus Poribacteria bacterium]MYC39947.1 hypothetical protein [Candidatus Dadabacteria bacterium]
MNKAENSLSGLVHPLNDSATEVLLVKQCLQELGFSETDQAWLVAVFKRPDCFGDSHGVAFNDEFAVYAAEHILPRTVEGFTEPVQSEKNQQTRLAFLFHSLLGFGKLSSKAWLPTVGLQELDDSTDIPGWVLEFQKHAQFCAQNLDWGQLKTLPHFDNLLLFLLPEGVCLDQIVDLDLLNPIPRRNLSSNDPMDPKHLESWLIWRFRAEENRRENVRLEPLLATFSGFSDDVLGDKILGLLNTIYDAMTRASWGLEKGLDPLNDGWRVVAHELIPFLELLSHRKPEAIQERSPLLKAWWHLSTCIYSWSMGGLESELSEDLRKNLVESASRHIGILRSVLRDTPEVFEDENISDFYKKAFYILLAFAGPWKRLKPLLLAFTEMTEQAVASHLSFWNESGQEAPPHPYSQIPLWIGMSMYPQHLQDELKEDPHLQGLREEFAKFCLSRLRTKVKHKDSRYTNKDFVEPRPVWRGCYVQALKVLGVNPGGRAHRTLFWLLNNDPDRGVREYARRVHRQVRHLDRNRPNIEKGASPRRPLFEAFWWFRQAHLITLGVKVDQSGAMRTRRKELHRTRERDDRYERKG